MNKLTHVLMGMGGLWLVLALNSASLVVAILGVSASPFLSRLPDRDMQAPMISHRGPFSHDLLWYTLPMLMGSYLAWNNVIDPIFLHILLIIFCPLALHVFVDMFNTKGVYLGYFFRVTGRFAWDSYLANLIFRSIGLFGFFLGCYFFALSL